MFHLRSWLCWWQEGVFGSNSEAEIEEEACFLASHFSEQTAPLSCEELEPMHDVPDTGKRVRWCCSELE